MTLNLGKLHATIEIDDKPAGRGIDRVAVKMAGFQKGTTQTLNQIETKMAETGADGGKAMGDGIAEGGKAGVDKAANAVADGAPKLKQVAADSGDAAGKALGDQMQLRAAEGVAGIYRDARGRLHLPTGAFVKEGALITEAMLQGARKNRPAFSKEGDALGDALGKGVGAGLGRNIEAIHGQMDQITKKAGGVRGILSILGKTTAFTAMATGAAGAVSSIGPLLGLVGALSVAAGGLAGTVAVLAAGGVVALGALKVGFTDLGAAITGDEEALARLSPSARKFAGVLRELAPAWDRVVRGVQERLFKGLADDVAKVASKWMPLLATGLGKVASGWNAVGSSTARALLQTRVIEGFNKLTSATEQGLRNFATGIGPWLEGIGVLIGAWSPLLADAGAWTARLGERWRDWMVEAEETGRLASTIQTMKDTLSLLGDIAGNVGGILGSVFSSANEHGGGLLGVISDLTGRLDEFLNSAEGESALGSFFQSLNKIGDAVLPIILEIAEAIATDLAPAFADIATTAGPSLRDLVEEIGDALGKIDAKTLAEGFVDVLDAVIPLVGPLGDLLGYVTSIEGLVPALVIALGLWTVAQWALNVAMLANPIGIIIVLAAALIAAIVLIVIHWDEVVAAIGDRWELLKAIWQSGKDFVTGLWRAVGEFISDQVDMTIDAIHAFASLPSLVAAWILDMKDRAIARFQEFLSAANAKVDAVLGAIQRMGGIPGKVAGFIQSAKDSAISKFQSLVDWVQGLPDRILDALGDLGSLLKNVGRDIINGLINGIQEKFGDVQDMLGDLTDMLPDWKGPAEKDRRLFRKPAQLIMGGFAADLKSMFPLIERTLGDFTSDIGLQVDQAAAPPAAAPRTSGFTPEDRAFLAGIGSGQQRPEQTFVINGADTDTATLAHDIDWLSRRRP